MRNLIFLLVLLLVGCKTTKEIDHQSNTLVKIDTVYQKMVDYDSIYIYNDMNTYQKGETVFVYKTKIEYRNKLKIDTIYKTNIVEKKDSVYIEKKIEVPRKRNWFDWISYMSLIGVFVYVIWKIKK